MVDILSKGEGWLAVNKPSGISVHNNKEDDLLSQVTALFDPGQKVFLLNRLDAGTSGIVMFATQKKIASGIQKQFENRSVRKTYLAICQKSDSGKNFLAKSGEWKWYLTKKAEGHSNPQGFQKMRVPCKTEWELLKENGNIAYLRLNPSTGRKHQIRRHAALAGWPIQGDHRYGLRSHDISKDGSDLRLSLEAFQLDFTDPTTEKKVSVRMPISGLFDPDEFLTLESDPLK